MAKIGSKEPLEGRRMGAEESKPIHSFAPILINLTSLGAFSAVKKMRVKKWKKLISFFLTPIFLTACWLGSYFLPHTQRSEVRLLPTNNAELW